MKKKKECDLMTPVLINEPKTSVVQVPILGSDLKLNVYIRKSFGNFWLSGVDPVGSQISDRVLK